MTGRRRVCLCEHARHWAPVDGEHSYGVPADDVVDVDTPFGVYPLCAACRDECHGSHPRNVPIEESR